MSAFTVDNVTERFRAAPDRYIDVGEGEVAVRTFGSGPDVLLIPGWPVSGAVYRSIVPALAEHVTCHVIDMPGSGSSRYDETTTITIEQHVETIRRVVDALDVDDLAVVAQDSGGMIARHALVDAPRIRAYGLINTEQPQGFSWRFKIFLAGRNIPGFGAILGWASGTRWVRRNKFVFGDALVDRAHLDGAFDEFFLQPLHTSKQARGAAMQLFHALKKEHFTDLAEIHPRSECPVHLVWGVEDVFFPIGWTREMVNTFPNATLTEVEDAALFPHVEQPDVVVEALLPTLTA